MMQMETTIKWPAKVIYLEMTEFALIGNYEIDDGKNSTKNEDNGESKYLQDIELSVPVYLYEWSLEDLGKYLKTIFI